MPTMRAFRWLQLREWLEVPPAALTREIPEVAVAVNTIVSSGPQEAPRLAASPSVVGGPPPIGTFLSFSLCQVNDAARRNRAADEPEPLSIR